MLLDVFPVGPIQANCVLVGDQKANTMAIIDPGGEPERIAQRVRASGLEPSIVLLTHGHLDHAGGLGGLAEALGTQLPVALHEAELPLYRSLPMQGMMFGIPTDAPPEPSRLLTHGDTVEVGALALEVRHTPGHSPGSVIFRLTNGPEPVVIAGDLIFLGSVGRTDLMGGSYAELERSIREQLYTLPDDTRLVCGHGPDTTVGQEKRSNMVVRG
jgi:glyoxylase-like metal-dependent hydrolase (beta-lactamase superfamily II)